MRAIRYGWVIVTVGLFANMTGLGFGRFAYPMLIPGMRGSLGFSYSEMGLLSGAIMLGYLLFSLLGGMLTSRFGPRRIVIASLVCGALSMFLIGRSSGFFPLLIFTFFMGAGGAGTHISMTTLPMAWFAEKKLGRALGVVTAGTGLGIVVTGLLLPVLLTFGEEAWRQSWLLLSSITFMVAFVGWMTLKERPGETAVLPSAAKLDSEQGRRPKSDGDFGLKVIFVVYFVFGFAYNIFATYFVSYMTEDLLLPSKTAGGIWAVFGWMCMISGLLWGFVSDHVGRRRALLWNNGIIAFSALLPLLLPQCLFLTLAALLFGGTFLGTVIIIAAAVGNRVPKKTASIYGLVSLVHGIGQLLGTTTGGYLKDLTGSFQLNLVASVIGFVFCVCVVAFSGRSEGRDVASDARQGA